jgi:hypothetical protein
MNNLRITTNNEQIVRALQSAGECSTLYLFVVIC